MISNMSTLIAHYTKLETAAHYILPKEALRISMGAFLSFNDPKETKGWHFKTSEKMTINQHQLFHERRISSEIKKHFGALSFSNGMEESTDQFNFNRCDYKPRMWAQYGDNSKGLCLVFNKEKLFELAKQQFDNIAMVFADDVQYFNITGLPDFTDNEVTLPKEYILNESHDKIVQMILKSEHRKPYFFLKHSDWKEENEYRIVVYMQQQPEAPKYGYTTNEQKPDLNADSNINIKVINPPPSSPTIIFLISLASRSRFFNFFLFNI